jgi:hypothetical protein
MADIGRGSALTLDERHAKGIGTSSDMVISHTDEILPDGPNQVVLMGEFRDFDVVLTSSRRSIYTEMHIFVERVLRDTTPVRAGQTITVFSRGGLIIANDGQVLRDNIIPLSFVIQPRHRYVMFLRYYSEGDFYSLQKTIELRDGKALPNSLPDVNRSEKGEWPYLNLDEETTLQRISTTLSERGVRK